MTVRVAIERLILDGLPIGRADAEAVRLAIEAELTRLIAANRLSDAAARSVASVAAAPIQIVAAAGPQAIGEQVARSLFATVSSAPPPAAAMRGGGAGGAGEMRARMPALPGRGRA